MTCAYTGRVNTREGSVPPTLEHARRVKGCAKVIEDVDMTWTHTEYPLSQHGNVTVECSADTPTPLIGGTGYSQESVGRDVNVATPRIHAGHRGSPPTTNRRTEHRSAQGATAPDGLEHGYGQRVHRDLERAHIDGAPRRPRTVRNQTVGSARYERVTDRGTHLVRTELGAGGVYRRRIERKATP